MPRRKVVMRFIQNAKKRQSTYKKRQDSVVKKIEQLAALCGVKVLFVDLKPGTAGERGGITTWPEDRGAVRELIRQYREKDPDKIKEKLTTTTYLRGELAKEERKLVKVNLCRLDEVLTLWDFRLDDLSADGLIALYDALSRTWERVRRRVAELRSARSGVTAPALQHAPAFAGNAFDLNLSDAGSSIGVQDHCYLPPDILPQPAPVQKPYVGFKLHMHPPYNTFGGPPMPFMPFPMVAPPDFSVTGGGINIMDRLPAAIAGVYDDFAMQGPGQGSAAGAAVAYHQDFLAHSFDATAGTGAGAYGFDAARTGAGAYGFDATSGTGAGAYSFDATAGTGAGYELQPRAAGVWPLGIPNSPVDTAAYQLQNDTVMWSDNGLGHHALGEQEEQSGLRLFHRRM